MPKKERTLTVVFRKENDGHSPRSIMCYGLAGEHTTADWFYLSLNTSASPV